MKEINRLEQPIKIDKLAYEFRKKYGLTINIKNEIDEYIPEYLENLPPMRNFEISILIAEIIWQSNIHIARKNNPPIDKNRG